MSGSRILPGGGADPPGGGANIQICQVFPKNCMKLRKFWSVGGGAPLGSATGLCYLVLSYTGRARLIRTRLIRSST